MGLRYPVLEFAYKASRMSNTSRSLLYVSFLVTIENHKRDLQKRSTKEIYKRDLLKFAYKVSRMSNTSWSVLNVSFVCLFCMSLLYVSFVYLFCMSLLYVSFVCLFCMSLL